MFNPKRSLLILVMLCVCFWAHGQFTGSTNEPGTTRWMSISSPSFRMIYPKGTDSLAVAYLRALEHYRPLVAPSIGMVSGQFQTKPLDVVLYPENSASNGYVTWTPSRMELLTIPDWNTASSQLWMDRLAVHEGRHAAQMQAGYRRIFRPFRYIAGQIIPGAVSVYPGSLLMEGDAVVAETALSSSGRGRDSRFLAQYMYSLDNGDLRNYPKWRFGSYYKPTPNNYALGYVMISAARTLYDAPYFMAEYMDYVGRRPYDPWPLRHNLRRVSGQKFQPTFRDLMNAHYREWAADTLQRGPFMPHELVGRRNFGMTEYNNPNDVADNSHIWVKHNIFRNPVLVDIDTAGREKVLAAMPSFIGSVTSSEDGHHLVWNEVRRHPRWGQKYGSVIMKYDLDSHCKSQLTSREHNYVKPVVMDSARIAVIEYKPEGTHCISVLDSENGRRIGHVNAPDSLQLFSITYSEGDFYVIGVTSQGSGIWKCDGNKWENVLEPTFSNMEYLDHKGGKLLFDSDHNGNWELYSYDPADSTLLQLTSTKYGGADYTILPDSDIVYTQLNGKGNAIYRTKGADVKPRKVEWKDVHRYAIADNLSAQEDTLVFNQRLRHPRKVDLTPATQFSAPERYRKGAASFRFHSWAPCYVDMDVINNLSYDNVAHIASLGAMGFFQNSVGTLSGYLGYKAAPNTTGVGPSWLHSGHMQLTYKGLYPVFELQAHVGERMRRQYTKYNMLFAGNPDRNLGVLYSQVDQKKNVPLVNVSLTTYVPLQWGGGVWSFGFIPQIGVHYYNDRLDALHTVLLNAGVRAYMMQRTPSAAVYPRWGVGGELKWLDPNAYAMLYAYLPGPLGQGLKLSVLKQWITPLSTNELYTSAANLIPRGLSLSPYTYCEGIKFSADYAIPFSMGDWNIGSALMCTRGIFTPFFDYSRIKENEAILLQDHHNAGGSLYSVGANFEMEFASFFWIKTPVTVGITASYNGGGLCRQLGCKPYFVGALFNIDIPN